jgi:SulP family sulfate permease
MIDHFFTLFQKNKKYFRADILAGITVALALIPEAIAFAFVAHVPPLLSLQTAIVVALVAALFTGRPGMVSASTAAIAVVLAPLVLQHGLQYLFATVILMGSIQILFGICRLGKFTNIIPRSVVLGFLNGLALVIFIAQWEQFKVKETVLIDGIETIKHVWMPMTDITIMLGFVILTMAIIYYFPRLTKAVPSSLVAIAFTTTASIILVKIGLYALPTVQDFAGTALTGELPSLLFPDIPFSLETLKIIFPYALVGALVGLTEASLTLRVIDDMTDTKGKIDREFFAQGFSNTASGFFGGMGGCAMIGQSIINVQSGGRTRLAGITAAIALLLFLLFAAPLVNAIPLASLVGLMFTVVISTFAWESLKYRNKIPTQDFFIIGVVSLTTVFINLAMAVILGFVLATIIFAWEKGKRLEVKIIQESKIKKIYQIHGIIFFGSVINLKELFTIKDDPKNITLDLQYAKVMDFSAIEALDWLSEKYRKSGKKLRVIRPGENCKILLKNAENITNIEIEEEVESLPQN